MDTLLVRCRDGKGGEAGILQLSTRGSGANFIALKFQVTSVSVLGAGESKTLGIDELMISCDVPIEDASSDKTRVQWRSVTLSADLDIREGQTAVVGKAGVSSSDGAVFAVVSARVVD